VVTTTTHHSPLTTLKLGSGLPPPLRAEGSPSSTEFTQGVSHPGAQVLQVRSVCHSATPARCYDLLGLRVSFGLASQFTAVDSAGQGSSWKRMVAVQSCRAEKGIDPLVPWVTAPSLPPISTWRRYGPARGFRTCRRARGVTKGPGCLSENAFHEFHRDTPRGNQSRGAGWQKVASHCQVGLYRKWCGSVVGVEVVHFPSGSVARWKAFLQQDV
jgi:hypothetical protein